MRNDRDFHTCTLRQACHENRLPCRERLRHDIAVGSVHPRVIPRIDQENRCLHHMLQPEPSFLEDPTNIGKALTRGRLDGLLDEVGGGGVEGDLA